MKASSYYSYTATYVSRGGAQHGLGRRGVEVIIKFTCFTGIKVQILTEEAGWRLALLRAMMYKRKPEAEVPPKKGLIPGRSLASVSVPLY
jgi:hypothetical protein